MAAISSAVQLAACKLELELAPAIGGSVAAFRLDGTELLTPLSNADRAAGNG